MLARVESEIMRVTKSRNLLRKGNEVNKGVKLNRGKYKKTESSTKTTTQSLRERGCNLKGCKIESEGREEVGNSQCQKMRVKEKQNWRWIERNIKLE